MDELKYIFDMIMSKKLEGGWGEGAAPPPMAFGGQKREHCMNDR